MAIMVNNYSKNYQLILGEFAVKVQSSNLFPSFLIENLFICINYKRNMYKEVVKKTG